MKRAVAVLPLVLLGGWVLMKRSPAPVIQRLPQVQAIPVTDSARRPTAEAALSQKAGSASIPSVASASESLSVAPEIRKNLQDYQLWHSKTFLTPAEEQAKKVMVKDALLITRLGQILSDSTLMSNPKFEEMENAALDLLIEALQKGDHQASLQVIQTIVQDPQVENSNLPKKVRETLAGIKAELLYQAAALAPQELAQMESSLPGPVTQKIWENVQASHEQNLAESQAEVQAHLAQSTH